MPAEKGIPKPEASAKRMDGKRLLRWLRHIKDHQGEWYMDDIKQLE